jgi:hypothetical protein
MKWMGGWTLSDYENAPHGLIDDILLAIDRENKQIEEIRKKSGAKSDSDSYRVDRDASGKPKIVSIDKDAVAATTSKSEVDPKTGREVVTKVKPDGSVVKHRKIEAGELLIHQIFGPPKSFQGK